LAAVCRAQRRRYDALLGRIDRKGGNGDAQLRRDGLQKRQVHRGDAKPFARAARA